MRGVSKDFVFIETSMSAESLVHFDILIDMLQIAFCNTISENQYTKVVDCINKYATMQGGLCPSDKNLLVQQQRQHLAAKQWPIEYDPIDHVCDLRYAFAFGQPSMAVEEQLHRMTQCGIVA